MPIKSCQLDGKPGWKWGDSGKCYIYQPDSEASSKSAKRKAIRQGIAAGGAYSRIIKPLEKK